MWVDPGKIGGGMTGAFMLGMFMSGLDCYPASTFSNHCSSKVKRLRKGKGPGGGAWGCNEATGWGLVGHSC